jgi:hypothetical protein
VRACFERRFTVERMAHDYVEIYRRLLRQSHGEAANAPFGASDELLSATA